MRTGKLPSDAAVISSLVFVLAGLPRFRPLVALTFVPVLVAVPLTEAFAVILATGVKFLLIELLVDRGAVAMASEVLLGLDDDAVGCTPCFCLLVAAVLVASAAVFALRLAGAMIFNALGNFLGNMCGSEVYFRSDSHMRVTARRALAHLA